MEALSKEWGRIAILSNANLRQAISAIMEVLAGITKAKIRVNAQVRKSHAIMDGQNSMINVVADARRQHGHKEDHTVMIQKGIIQCAM